MLFEFHLLQNHAPANLNRDDTNSPKDCMFGGVKRARISSQCLKRSIRVSESFGRGLKSATVPLGQRTRKLPALVSEKVQEQLLQAGVEPELAKELGALASLKASGFGTEAGKENAKGEARTAQTMFLTTADIEAVANVIGRKALELAAEDPKKAAEKFKKVTAKDLQDTKELREWRPITVDIALFGRMVTSPAFQDVEASMQVAHALSTHQVEMEFDYFTAVDDLQKSEGHDEVGADMIGEVEFNSACFYKYFSLHLDGLLENLTGKSGDRGRAVEIAEAVIPAFLESAIVSNPSGKQNTFAAHNLPSAVLVEVRPYPQPVSYANAFVKPARTTRDRDLVEDSVLKLREHVEKTNKVYSPPSTARFWLSLDGFTAPEGVEEIGSLGELRQRLATLVQEGASAGV